MLDVSAPSDNMKTCAMCIWHSKVQHVHINSNSETRAEKKAISSHCSFSVCNQATVRFHGILFGSEKISAEVPVKNLFIALIEELFDIRIINYH